MSILVVDDTDDTRAMTATFLGLMGFTVNEARTGSQALELAAEQPDLIILDVRLPDMDGFEVCRRLKADPATATIPVLHLSAHHRTANDRIRGIEEGADAYLLQPADPDELIATVKALLRRRQPPDISHAGSASELSPRRRAEEAATALVDVGRALSAAPDVTRVTQRAVETVHRLFGVRRSVFYEFDRTSSTLVCVATGRRWRMA